MPNPNQDPNPYASPLADPESLEEEAILKSSRFG